MTINEKCLFLGNDIKLTGDITIHNPTLDEIYSFGETEYWLAVNAILNIPKKNKESLLQHGINYKYVSDFMFFCFDVSRDLTPERTRLLLGDLDLSKFEPVENTVTNEVALYNFDSGVVIDSNTYELMVENIKLMHGLEENCPIKNQHNPMVKKIYDKMPEVGALNISTVNDFIRRGILENGGCVCEGLM